MIKNIQLKFGSHPDSEKLSIETTPVTVFVGPNNSGKSKLLSKIQNSCMRTIAINTKSDNVFIFNMLNKIQFTNKADVCEQAVRIQEFKFA